MRSRITRQHLADQLGVERARDLVEQQRARPGGERAHDRHALLLAAREPVGALVLAPAEPEPRQQLAAALARLLAAASPCARTGPSATLSSTDMWGNRLKAWKTMPSRRRMAVGSTLGSVITSPSSSTSPSSISSSRSTQRSSVDLPEPEAPISATASCSFTVRSIPRSTSASP